MLRHLSRLSKHSIIYGLGTVSFPLVNFLLIPVYTRYLSPDDYGVLSLLMLTQWVMLLIVALGLPTALLRFYAYYDDERDQAELVGTSLIFGGAVAVLITSVLMAASKGFSLLVFHSADHTTLFLVTFLAIPFNVGIVLAMSIFRSREESKKYLMFTVAQLLVSAGLKVLFLVVLKQGVQGVLVADLICMAVFCVVLIGGLVRNAVPKFSWAKLKMMLAFSIPLVPASLAGFLLVACDRYLLQFLSTPEQVGLYSLGYNFGRIADTVISAPFNLAWVPFMVGMAKEKNAERVYSSVLTYFVLFGTFVVLGLSVLSRDVIRIMSTPSFYDAYRIVPLIALSYLLYGAFSVMQTGIYLKNKTKYLAIIVGAVAIFNAGLCYVLVGRYGMMGAATATLISFAILPIAVYFVSRRFYPISYDFGRVAKILLAAVPVYVASLFISHGSVVVEAVLRATTLLAYPVLLYVLRFYKPEEVRTVRKLVSDARGLVRVKWSKK